MKKIYILFSLLIIMLVFPSTVYAEDSDDDEHIVLFLNSYGTKYTTLEEFSTGLSEGLDDSIEIYYEFMDTKKTSYTEAYKLAFHDFFIVKYASLMSSFDCIVIADDNALDFVTEYNDELFLNIPKVFMGVNNEASATEAHTNMEATGLVETFSYDSNLDLALSLIENPEKIYIIFDGSKESEGAILQFDSAYQKGYSSIPLEKINTSDYTYDELLLKLSTVSNDSLNFFISISNTSDKEALSLIEKNEIYAQFQKAPWFKSNISEIGTYFVGGVFYDYYAASVRAGQIVNSVVIHNISVSNISVTTDPYNKVVLDYTMANNFGINLANAPVNTVIVGEDLSFAQENPVVFTLIIIISILTVAIGLMIFLHYKDKQKQAEKLNKQTSILDYLSKKDSLTGLSNRNTFSDETEELIKKSTPFFLLLCDIDDFKTINDTYGHKVADEVLVNISSNLNSVEDSYTKVYRYAGDEFIIVFIAQDENLVQRQIDHISNRIQGSYQVDNKTVDISFTMGISNFPDAGNTLQDLIACADSALFYAKKIARKKFEFYNESEHFKYKNTLYIKNLLKDAINRNGFYLTYRPIMDPKTQNIKFIETKLMLLNSKIGPDAFIPVAEQTGLIIDVGRICAKLTVEFLSRLQEKNLPLYPTTCHFSPFQLLDNDYTDYLDNLLVSHKINHKHIIISTWESKNAQIKKSNLKKFNSFIQVNNINLILDGFGNSDGSLSYLFSLPVSYVKCRKKFVTNLISNEESLKSLFDFVHSLNIKVIAEGTNGRSFLTKLNNAGVDLTLGFFYNYPIEEDEFLFAFYKDHENY